MFHCLVVFDGSVFIVTLDIQGTQYAGRIYPGPTAMVLAAVHNNNNGTEEPPYFKVEGMTDEFCSLTKIGDAMTQMNAVDAFGARVDTSSYYYHNEDEDVNRPTTASKQQEQQQDGNVTVPGALQQQEKQPGQKRKRGLKSNAAPARKKKAGKARKK